MLRTLFAIFFLFCVPSIGGMAQERAGTSTEQDGRPQDGRPRYAPLSTGVKPTNRCNRLCFMTQAGITPSRCWLPCIRGVATTDKPIPRMEFGVSPRDGF